MQREYRPFVRSVNEPNILHLFPDQHLPADHIEHADKALYRIGAIVRRVVFRFIDHRVAIQPHVQTELRHGLRQGQFIYAGGIASNAQPLSGLPLIGKQHIRADAPGLVDLREAEYIVGHGVQQKALCRLNGFRHALLRGHVQHHRQGLDEHGHAARQPRIAAPVVDRGKHRGFAARIGLQSQPKGRGEEGVQRQSMPLAVAPHCFRARPATGPFGGDVFIRARLWLAQRQGLALNAAALALIPRSRRLEALRGPRRLLVQRKLKAGVAFGFDFTAGIGCAEILEQYQQGIAVRHDVMGIHEQVLALGTVDQRHAAQQLTVFQIKGPHKRVYGRQMIEALDPDDDAVAAPCHGFAVFVMTDGHGQEGMGCQYLFKCAVKPGHIHPFVQPAQTGEVVYSRPLKPQAFHEYALLGHAQGIVLPLLPDLRRFAAFIQHRSQRTDRRLTHDVAHVYMPVQHVVDHRRQSYDGDGAEAQSRQICRDAEAVHAEDLRYDGIEGPFRVGLRFDNVGAFSELRLRQGLAVQLAIGCHGHGG